MKMTGWPGDPTTWSASTTTRSAAMRVWVLAAPDATADSAMVPPIAAVPVPAEQPCATPPPALAAELGRKVNAELVRQRQIKSASDPIVVTTICEESDGWLVSAAWAEPDSLYGDRTGGAGTREQGGHRPARVSVGV